MIQSVPQNSTNDVDFSPLWLGAKTVAVVGLSPQEARPSNLVARYLLAQGFTVIPVNPGQTEILGQKCYPRLTDIGQHIDIVDIFRKSTDVMPIVAEAIEIGATSIWMQEGVINEEAALLAKSHGLAVVMDRCLMVEHWRDKNKSHR